MAYTILFAESVADDLKALRAFDRQLILDRIDEQLIHQPCTETRNRKAIRGLVPPWEHVPPIWELRIRHFRVFYDVNAEQLEVTIRAVRQKLPHQTTEDIL